MIEWLAAIFDHVAAPVPLNELVAWLADFLDLSEPQQDEASTLANHHAAEVDPAWLDEQRGFLTRLWEEVSELPNYQRAALLLNLRDEAGRGCTAFFLITCIAALAQLAATLEMTAEQFADIWHELPLEDARIAELFFRTGCKF